MLLLLLVSALFIVAEGCTYGDVRLEDGDTQFEGRVEVCVNSSWHTVCDDSWGAPDARVVCSQLGYSYSGYGVALLNAYFGGGSGTIALQKVACTGSESQLLACKSNTIFDTTCSHSDDAGVRCEAPCSNGDLRLVDGNINNEGRVEICVDNVWGTVCDDSFSSVDAQVVCRKLGYLTTDTLAFSYALFGSGSGNIFLDNVGCSGGESSLLDCTYISGSSCTHSEDVGVRCQVNSTGSVCSYGDIRLVGGDNMYEGRVEVCISNGWHTVCDDGWSAYDARVVCSQLGYSYTGTGPYKTNAAYGQGTGSIAIENTACSGSESQLLACSSSPIFGTTCTHSEDAGAECEAPCSNGDLRLDDGNVNNEGRVEICVGNVWGTVCDDSFSSVDAQVVCRKLGYLTTDALAFSYAHFGSGSGSIFLDNVGCSGGESSLLDCTYISGSSCTHSEDVGVRCQVNSTGSVCSFGDIRLVGGNNVYEGRLEVCISDTWGTVCGDSFGTYDANTVCKQLGYAYTGNGKYYASSKFGAGSGKIWLDNLACTSSTTKILQCPSNPIGEHNCVHSDDIGVGCEAPCTNGQIRLVGGIVTNEGRIEICFSNEWGTICDDNWGKSDATVACNQLGYSTTDAVAFSSAHFGSGSGTIFLDNVGCSGTESSLLDCSYSSGSSVTCFSGHSEDAGIRCQLAATTETTSSSSSSSSSYSSSSSKSLLVTSTVKSTPVSSSVSKSSSVISTADSTSITTSTISSTSSSMIMTSSSSVVSFSVSSSVSKSSSVISTADSTSITTSTISSTSSSMIMTSSSSVVSFSVSSSVSSSISSSSSIMSSTDLVSSTTSSVSTTSSSSVVSLSVSSSVSSSSIISTTDLVSSTISSVSTTSSSSMVLSSVSSSVSSSISSSLVDISTTSSVSPTSSSILLSPSSSSSVVSSISTSSSVISTAGSMSPSRPKSLMSSTSTGLSTVSMKVTSSSVLSTTVVVPTTMSSHLLSKSSSLVTSTSDHISSTSSSSSVSLSLSISKRVTRLTTFVTTSTYVTRSPEPTCTVSSRVINSTVVRENSLIAVIGDYSVFAFTSNAEEKFEKVTLDSITGYCSVYMTACSYINLTVFSGERSKKICLIISKVEANSDGLTEVSFFSISGDGTGLIPLQAVTDAVKAGESNKNYEAAGFSEIIFTPYVSTVDDSRGNESGQLSVAHIAGIGIGIILFVICTIVVFIVAVFFILYKSRTSKQYSIKDNVLTSTLPSDIQPTFKAGSGFTNMMAIDKDGGVVIETEQEKPDGETTVSSGV